MFKYNYKEGDIIGELIFIARIASKPGIPLADFRCICGNIFSCRIESVKKLRTKSCGCLTKKLISDSSIIHGHAVDGKKSTEYNTWQAMWDRVTNPNHQNYNRYRDKGILINKEWESFEVFIKDMGLKPSIYHTLDRKDNDKGYYKENCRWATKKQQQRNRSNTAFAEYNGETKSIAEWAELTGIALHTLYNRIIASKWDVNRAFTTPSKNNKIAQNV